MATQMTSGAATDKRGPRRQTSRGTLAGGGHLRGVATIAALVLALAASLAIGRASSSVPADATAPAQPRVIQFDPDADAYAMAQWARPADTFDWEQAERTRTGDAVYGGVPHRPAEACVYAGADGTPGEGCVPAAVAPVAPSQSESCVYAGATGIPGEGCVLAEPAARPSR